jgi:hypothetical protein
VTPDTPNLILNALATRSFTTVNVNTDLTLSFSTTNPIPVGAKIKISLPDD